VGRRGWVPTSPPRYVGEREGVVMRRRCERAMTRRVCQTGACVWSPLPFILSHYYPSCSQYLLPLYCCMQKKKILENHKTQKCFREVRKLFHAAPSTRMTTSQPLIPNSHVNFNTTPHGPSTPSHPFTVAVSHSFPEPYYSGPIPSSHEEIYSRHNSVHSTQYPSFTQVQCVI